MKESAANIHCNVARTPYLYTLCDRNEVRRMPVLASFAFKIIVFILPFITLNLHAQKTLTKKQAAAMEKDAQFFFDQDDYFKSWQLFTGCVRSGYADDRSVINSAICAKKLRYPVDSVRFLVKELSESKLPDAKFQLAK